ncbi:MAG TPA: aspartyl protease family protein [Bryobacteraceae bacterium]|nr:aspartyl protease family protein [Bryobacteraceae bacterium]
MKHHATLAAILLAAASLAAPAATLTTEQVLDRWAAALGGRAKIEAVRTVHLRGAIEAGGIKGTYERWATSNGALRTALDLSTFHPLTVFDGQQGWMQGPNGVAQALAAGVLQGTITSAYEASYSFLFPGRLPGRVELLDPYILRLTPEGGSPVTVHLDPETFLPQREETSGPMGTRTISFSDWRDSAGIKIPTTIRQSTGNAASDTVIRIEQIEINASLPADLFKEPAATSSEIRFTNGMHQAVIPVEVYQEHVYVPVRVNGGETAWFFLDSGAGGSTIGKAWAEKIALPFAGALNAQGAAGSAGVALAKDVVFNLQGLEFPIHSAAVMDFSAALPMIGRRWEGVLGYDLLSRTVVRVDYEHKQITVSDPATFVPNPQAAALAVTFLGNWPLVIAKVLLPGAAAPIETKVFIDSGASGLTLSTPFTNANHVVDSVRRKVSSSAYGAGGISTRYAGRIAGIQLGPYTLHNPVAAFSPGTKEGILASPDIGALVGGEILERFTVTFDYPHHQILLEPNSHFSDPFPANTSGLSLVAKGDGFQQIESDAIEPGSPAAKAGLRPGDVLVTIDGHPATEFTLENIDKMFQHPGRTIHLTVNRNGRVLTCIMKLTSRI